jgi:hypothetical protein
MIDNETLQNVVIKEYEKSQKNIQPVWIGEGWYKGAPNSFNYFSSGFAAGLNYQRLKTLEKLSELDQELGFQ